MERDCNMATDALSKIGSSRAQAPPEVFVQEVHLPSISPNSIEECKATGQDPSDWRIPIVKYIKNEEEPEDKVTVERLSRQSTHYTLIVNVLYRRGVFNTLMKCIDVAMGKHLLEEIHAR